MKSSELRLSADLRGLAQREPIIGAFLEIENKGELVILIGTFIATCVGVLIAYRKLKPGLRVRVVRCTHKVRYARSRISNVIAGTEVVVEFEIGNTGGKTTIFGVEIRAGYLLRTHSPDILSNPINFII